MEEEGILGPDASSAQAFYSSWRSEGWHDIETAYARRIGRSVEAPAERPGLTVAELLALVGA